MKNQEEKMTGKIRTKKAAREAGLLPACDWMKRVGGRLQLKVPVRSAVGVNVKNEEFFRADQCEDLVSKTEARRRNLRVGDDAESVMERGFSPEYGTVIWYELYRVSDCEPCPVRRRDWRAALRRKYGNAEAALGDARNAMDSLIAYCGKGNWRSERKVSCLHARLQAVLSRRGKKPLPSILYGFGWREDSPSQWEVGPLRRLVQWVVEELEAK